MKIAAHVTKLRLARESTGKGKVSNTKEFTFSLISTNVNDTVKKAVSQNETNDDSCQHSVDQKSVDQAPVQTLLPKIYEHSNDCISKVPASVTSIEDADFKFMD